MAKDERNLRPGKPEAQAEDARPQRPADSELRFQHVIRNMVVARDEARRPGD